MKIRSNKRDDTFNTYKCICTTDVNTQSPCNSLFRCYSERRSCFRFVLFSPFHCFYHSLLVETIVHATCYNRLLFRTKAEQKITIATKSKRASQESVEYLRNQHIRLETKAWAISFCQILIVHSL